VLDRAVFVTNVYLSTMMRVNSHFINQSLMTLGKVVYALSEMDPDNPKSKYQHVPYRDSKLTRLLQPSLSGNAQIVLICCVSPLVSHIEESHNSLKFATRAKKIPQKATIQESQDEKTLLQSYRKEIEELRQQLKEARVEQARGDSKSVASVESFGEVDDEEVRQLVISIQTMEKLILKSQSAVATMAPEDLMDDESDDDEDDNALMALMMNDPIPSPTRATSTPAAKRNDADLHHELKRIQGLLGSVIKKRSNGLVRGKSDEDEEVKQLRAQLEQKEAQSNMRKADSSFLQQQLEEKDSLLKEISDVLEQVEIRQSMLEEENKALRAELDIYKNGAV
jgi:hypothetical protein